MPQFRLTQKIAKDCKIKTLLEPTDTTNPLDDWFVNSMCYQRKKIAMFTHGKTAFTFFIPYAEAGSAKALFSYFKAYLKDFFDKHSLSMLSTQIDELFSQEFIFTKTVDKKILGHMNDFERCSESSFIVTYPVDWQEEAESINNMPINACRHGCSFPLDNFNELLDIKLPRKTTNRISEL